MSEQTRPPVYSSSQDDQRLPDPPLGSGGGSGASPCEPPAGFPSIASSATTQQATNTTSHAVNIPAGTSGQLGLLVFGHDGSPTASATGWTQVVAIQVSAVCGLAVLYRFYDGSESSTVTVTTTATEQSESWAAVFNSHHASTAPEGQTGSAGTAESRQLLPALTPSWGAANTTWLAIDVCDLSAAAGRFLVGQPVRYNFVHEQSNANTTGIFLAVCVRYVNAASEDPGEYLPDGPEQYASATVAIRPA